MNYTITHSKIGANYQVAIPKEVREKLNTSDGDTLHYTIFKEGVTIQKITQRNIEYLMALSKLFPEWLAEDDELYANL